MAFDWENFLLETSSTVLLSSGILYLILKTGLEASVKRKVELDVAKAKGEMEVDLAKVKGEIQGELDYKATKLKYVYEQKVVVLRDVYQKLWEFEQAVGQYVSLGGEVLGEQRTEAGNASLERMQELDKCFQPNRMFFSEELATKIANLRDGCLDAVTKFAIHVHRVVDTGEKHIPGKDSTEKWIQVNNFIKKESPAIRREIEQELRQEFEK